MSRSRGSYGLAASLAGTLLSLALGVQEPLDRDSDARLLARNPDVAHEYSLECQGRRDSVRLSSSSGGRRSDWVDHSVLTVRDARSGRFGDWLTGDGREEPFVRRLDELLIVNESRVDGRSERSEKTECCSIGMPVRLAFRDDGSVALEGPAPAGEWLAFDTDLGDALDAVLARGEDARLELPSLLGIVPDLFDICDGPTDPRAGHPSLFERPVWEAVDWRASELTVERSGDGAAEELRLELSIRGSGEHESIDEEEPFRLYLGLGYLAPEVVEQDVRVRAEGTVRLAWSMPRRRLREIDVRCRWTLEVVLTGRREGRWLSAESDWEGTGSALLVRRFDP